MYEIYLWIIITLGGGIIVTGGGILIFLGRKLKSLEDLEVSLMALKTSVVIRQYCKERHKNIDKRLETGEEKFEKFSEEVRSMGEAIARIDERTSKWNGPTQPSPQNK